MKFKVLSSNTGLHSYVSPSPTPPVPGLALRSGAGKGGEIVGVSPVKGGEIEKMPPVKGGEIEKMPPVKGGEHTPTPLSRGDLPSPLAGEGLPRRVEKLTQRGKGEGYHIFSNAKWYKFEVHCFKLSLFILCSVLFAFFLVANSYAAHPLITDDTGTQGTGKFELEVNVEYSNDNGGSTIQFAATLSSGIRENIDLVIGTPYQFLRTRDDDGGWATEDGISDILLELKWRFYEKDGLGFALKPGIILPTGDEDKGLGDGKPAYSLFFVTTKEIDPLILHFNLGYIKNRRELRDIWHYSLAGEYKVTKPLTIVANIGGETNPDRESNVHPVFLVGGIVYSLTENLDIDFGIKIGLNKAEADYTLLAGIILRW
jgi:hypothetical protein